MDPTHLSDGLNSSARASHIPGTQLAVLHHGEARVIEAGEEEHRGNMALAGKSRVPVEAITTTFTTTPAMMPVSDRDREPGYSRGPPTGRIPTGCQQIMPSSARSPFRGIPIR
jgi:hypothetical protein